MTSKDLLGRLCEWGAEPCVSFFTPIDRPTTEKVLATRLHNAARQAEHQLGERWGIARADAAAMVAPLQMAADTQLSNGHDPTLSIFCRAGQSEQAFVPLHLEDPLLTVSWRPNVLPLLVAQQADVDHVVLGLNRKHSRALRCGAFRWEDLPVSLPSGDELTVNHQRDMNSHGGGPGRGAIHGASGGNDHLDDAALTSYLRDVDACIRPMLEQDGLPLVVTGVGYEVAAFAGVSDYHRILAEPCGSTDRLSDQELHRIGQQAMVGFRMATTERELERLSNNSGHGLELSDLAAVQDAANSGRVGTLFVPQRLSTTEEADAELDSVLAVVASTLRHGGTVTIVPSERLDTTMALLRY